MDKIKPRIKNSHRIYQSEAGDVSIGEVGPSAYFVENPPEEFVTLLSLLTGERTVPRIKRDLRKTHPALTDEEIDQMLESLDQGTLLVDNARYSKTLTNNEIERYDRQMVQFEALDTNGDPGFVYQERLKETNACILGMGGWGTWISQNLALLGIGKLRLIDADDVELSNLNRQVLYDDTSLGKQKVEAARDALLRVNPNVNVEIVDEFVECDIDQIRRVLEGINLIVLCWANQAPFVKGTAEELIHEYAREKKIPIIELAGDPFDIAVGPIYPNDGVSPCLDCVKANMRQDWWGGDPMIVEFRRQATRALPLRRVNAWQSAPSLSAIAGLAASELMRFITGYAPSTLVGERVRISLADYDIKRDVYHRKEDCLNH